MSPRHRQQESPAKRVPESEIVAAAYAAGAHVRFTFQLCEQTAVVWQAVLFKDCLYLKPGDKLPDGSKEAFVALLEYTEEYLKCSYILVCFNKQTLDRAALVRTFMFLGFVVVPPSHPLAPKTGDYLSMLYTITDDESDCSIG